MIRNPLRGWRRGIALCGTLCATLGLVAAPAAAAPAPVPAVPVLDWQPCASGFLCATATVPLDYAHPAGATIQIAMIKHPATDPAHRIGSVFFNPGGSNVSGVDNLPGDLALIPATLRSRFDVVSFDPRGIGHSTLLNCFDTIDAENQVLTGFPTGYPLAYPVGRTEQRSWENAFAAFDRACAAHAGPLLAHLSTADLARDMDLMRQAVGDPTLNYLGVSAGTYLGATYANLFPDKVRALTLDGNIDPVAWATGTDGSARRLDVELRLGTDEGAAAALSGFLELCGRTAVTSCAFSAGTPAATRAKFDALLDRLATHPITLDGTTYTAPFTASLTDVLLDTVHPLPDADPGWAALAETLQEVWTGASGGVAPAIVTRAAKKLTAPDTGRGLAPNAGAPYSDGAEAFLGGYCSDSPNPRSPASYAAQSAFAAARSGAVGPLWAWLPEACARWPVLAADRYPGPWNRPTAHPILVVGNTVGSSTPYRGSVAMSRDLADARLLTVDGYGHAELFNPSSCVAAAESAYFVTGLLPPPGTVCQPDRPPFAE